MLLTHQPVSPPCFLADFQVWSIWGFLSWNSLQTRLVFESVSLLFLPSAPDHQGEVGGRDPCPPRVSNWSLFPMDRNSKISILGQSREEAGPCPDNRKGDYIFLILQVKETFPTQKLHEAKREWCQLPTDFFSGIHIGWVMHMYTWEDPETYQIRTQNQTKQDDWAEEIQKKCPIKQIQATTRAWLPLGPPVCLSTRTVLFLLINTWLVSLLCLCGNSFLQSWRAKALSLTAGLVAKTLCSHCWDSTLISGPQSLARNWNPASSCWRPRPPKTLGSPF